MGLFSWLNREFGMSEERKEYLGRVNESEPKDPIEDMYKDIVGSGKGRSSDHDNDHTAWDTNYDNTN